MTRFFLKRRCTADKLVRQITAMVAMGVAALGPQRLRLRPSALHLESRGAVEPAFSLSFPGCGVMLNWQLGKRQALLLTKLSARPAFAHMPRRPWHAITTTRLATSTALPAFSSLAHPACNCQHDTTAIPAILAAPAAPAAGNVAPVATLSLPPLPHRLRGSSAA